MTNTVSYSVLLLAATALVISMLVSNSEAAPFFTDNLPTVNLPNLRLPEIDPATMVQNGGQAIARTSDGVIVMFENGMQAFVRTSSGVVDGLLSIPQMFMRMARSLPFFG